jgi:beta-1,4-mannosyl-glycoprotein beta-1,4-N-acetylglucosaminyltransferase
LTLLRAIKNKKYPFFRVDTLFSDIKHQSVNLVSNGGWHFSNLKNVEELERKFLNDENHSEYEWQGS